MKTLVVFPLDDIDQYVKKGFIQHNYYNPNDFFDKIYIFNPSENKEINHELVQSMCGTAKYNLIFIGKQNTIQKLLYLNKNVKLCVEKIQHIKPTCIRSYGILFNAYIASKCAKQTQIPFVLSLHDNYDEVRKIALKSKKIIPFIFYTIWKRFSEINILLSATRVIAVFKYAKEYALNMGVDKNRIQVIYNKVDTSLFKPGNLKDETFTVINVMRQKWMKNQKVIIQAIAKLKDVNLVLIGDGDTHTHLIKLAKKLKCSDRVFFIKKVLNQNLPKYYQKSHVFVSAVKQGGVGIPDLEAFAVGLPVIHAKQVDEPNPDVLPVCSLMVNNSVESFANAISLLKEDKDLYDYYSNMGLEFSKVINYQTMSDKEEKLYEEAIKNETNKICNNWLR